ncbi:MAG: EscU/YscU/HrcU family type III secretion system export apparatus switch protein [Defluviitoga tunisiensis]|jgi:flagellar biosynthesis protein|uniref:Flagellar biosynthetic protein FlhB n=1 Tax=Defluviitoga tunisiensis TaxID=1006576 RepID=A0A0C7NZX7_DEFTU|nr:EscU/YscU/HrcU family type III secretion system export apparatus switch protein [Defluviitoga tunisiensis]MDD3601436.1 EscU/YscU/HrcU family type III secretion system export apparatus switch protein [Defluviitoga tunisiensis]CEP77560.1 flagellar biosynthetic protein FlhB [Defluviitoga tunisiensis]HOB55538.1 EscU/YscU/HrcU family type III secretion system export apparatus switch protein [Defluviitoga tunisiensis]HOK17047.1 EscU/YscU/HrcU family type III secretion system export apparatus switc
MEKKKVVALRYKKGVDNAPKVVAKGMDLIAQRILEIAEKENIPIIKNEKAVEDFYGIDLDDEIPSELYEIAAEIIAFVYKLDKQHI